MMTYIYLVDNDDDDAKSDRIVSYLTDGCLKIS